MLSILIPTYNYDITCLATELHRQAIEQMIDFELIVMEDGSTKNVDINKTIAELSNCKHIILSKNIGRSAIRNKLADEAIYEHLLFLDCDAEVSSDYYIERFLTFCHEDSVVLGGRIYDDNTNDPDLSLILKYGRKREKYNRPNINKNIHKVFMTPNFLISKTIFNKVRFDESIIGYGHEDTVFGIELQQLGIDFLLIDNPIIHKGLENNDVYISKNEYSLENLYKIYLIGNHPTLETTSKVLSWFVKAKKYRLNGFISMVFIIFKPILLWNLKGANPILILFDFYKLGYLCTYSLV